MAAGFIQTDIISDAQYAELGGHMGRVVAIIQNTFPRIDSWITFFFIKFSIKQLFKQKNKNKMFLFKWLSVSIDSVGNNGLDQSKMNGWAYLFEAQKVSAGAYLVWHHGTYFKYIWRFVKVKAILTSDSLDLFFVWNYRVGSIHNP